MRSRQSVQKTKADPFLKRCCKRLGSPLACVRSGIATGCRCFMIVFVAVVSIADQQRMIDLFYGFPHW